MKKLILTVALGVACASAFAQGQLNFSNFGSGANAPWFDADGTTKLAGAGFQADLWWAAGTVTDSSVLVALGQPANFASSGYFLGGSRTITGQTGTITGQVRVWDTAHGSSWTQASTAAGAHVGESALFQISLTQPPTTPNSLTGLNGQTLVLRVVNVPEPSTIALAGLGLAGLLVIRRRK
jgi:hypothetical protein